MKWNDPNARTAFTSRKQTVELPASKNVYSEKINVTTENVIYGTSKSMIKYQGSYNAIHNRDREMIAVRWKNYWIYHQSFAQGKKFCLHALDALLI